MQKSTRATIPATEPPTPCHDSDHWVRVEIDEELYNSVESNLSPGQTVDTMVAAAAWCLLIKRDPPKNG